jgi:hypothetical protein
MCVALAIFALKDDLDAVRPSALGPSESDAENDAQVMTGGTCGAEIVSSPAPIMCAIPLSTRTKSQSIA